MRYLGFAFSLWGVACGGIQLNDADRQAGAAATAGGGGVGSASAGAAGSGVASSAAGVGGVGGTSVIGLPSGAGQGGSAAGKSGASATEAEGGEGVDLGLGAGDLSLLVIFDRSGSMATGWDGRSRWQVANEAFMKAIEGVISNLTIGAVFFPQPGGCDVATLDSGAQLGFMPGATFRSTWLETVSGSNPDGSTPLELAFRVADQAIGQASELGLLTERFRVILVTDGEPTCSDDPNVVTGLAAAWHQRGVETWVMGLPGSQGAHDLLDAIAFAGGTGQHQSLGTPTELDDGLYAAAR